MNDLTTKLAEALRWIADYPHTHDSHLIAMRNGAREALRLYDEAKAQPVQGTSPLSDFVECPVCEGPVAKEDASLWLVQQWARMPLDNARAAMAATPAPAPQAKPLTTEQTAKLFAEVNSLMPGLDTPEEMFATIVRFVEREHGIGQGKEASNG